MKYADASVARGCGRARVRGGGYWETGFDKHGQPIQFFIIDPPQKIDIETMGVSPQGMKMIQTKDGTAHVLDWVGAMHYPNVTDFLEEARRFGISRRLELSKDEYALLTPKSRLICVHSAAFFELPEIHWGVRIGFDDPFFANYGWTNCPKELIDHEFSKEDMLGLMAEDVQPPMCAGLWWEDCMFVEPIEKDSRLGFREMPAFRYRCAASPASPYKDTPRSPAVFASFPLGRIAVVEDPDGGTHLDKLDKLSVCSVQVDLVQE